MTAAKALTLTIPKWVPPNVSNGPHGHWSGAAKQRSDVKIRVFAHAWIYWPHDNNSVDWARLPKRLTVEFVFPVKRKRDLDGLVSRCKALIDALVPYWLVDDDTSHLVDLVVRERVERGVTATVITLEVAP